MNFRKILIAVDTGPLAVHAAETGAELAHALKAEIAFIHVINASLVYSAESGIPPNQLVAAAKKEAKQLISDFHRRLSPRATAHEFTPVGSPDAEIVNAAKEWPADVIVIGSHGRKGLQRALLGSVAEGVMRQAPCPVLVVRAKE